MLGMVMERHSGMYHRAKRDFRIPPLLPEVADPADHPLAVPVWTAWTAEHPVLHVSQGSASIRPMAACGTDGVTLALGGGAHHQGVLVSSRVSVI